MPSSTSGSRLGPQKLGEEEEEEEEEDDDDDDETADKCSSITALFLNCVGGFSV